MRLDVLCQWPTMSMVHANSNSEHCWHSCRPKSLTTTSSLVCKILNKLVRWAPSRCSKRPVSGTATPLSLCLCSSLTISFTFRFLIQFTCPESDPGHILGLDLGLHLLFRSILGQYFHCVCLWTCFPKPKPDAPLLMHIVSSLAWTLGTYWPQSNVSLSYFDFGVKQSPVWCSVCLQCSSSPALQAL